MTDAPAPAWGDSALLVPIPEAEPVVAAFRLRHDAVASRGIPAHVTVLFPFVPASQLDQSLHDELRGLFGRLTGFPYRFERVEQFGETTVYLAPDRPSRFAALTEAVATLWPEHPPYGGAYAEVIPHLTVGDQLTDGAADRLREELDGILASHGAVTGYASEVWLMTEEATGRWSVTAQYPLAVRGGQE